MKDLFLAEFQKICPGRAGPDADLRFYPYAHLNHTIRLRKGKLWIRLSDLLDGAPSDVLRAILHLLLARLYRRRASPQALELYRDYVRGHQVQQRLAAVRRQRGHKRGLSPEGRHYHLEEIFQRLNALHFGNRLSVDRLLWTEGRARYSLGHYDPYHHTITINRRLDSPRVPRFMVEYVVYHEMLHMLFDDEHHNGRRCSHTAAFRRQERRFPSYDRATAFLKNF